MWLPELAMGLIPGAGGTVSLPGRIGAARAAWMALSGQRVDVDTALRWGLIDAVADGEREYPLPFERGIRRRDRWPG